MCCVMEPLPRDGWLLPVLLPPDVGGDICREHCEGRSVRLYSGIETEKHRKTGDRDGLAED